MPAPTSTLETIKTKVRRLTRSPSAAQLSEADLLQYINTFVVYDFPEHLRTFNLRKQFTFYTNAFQDVYPTDTISFAGAVNNPLYNFQNLYLTIHDPFYIAGFQAYFTQSREQFFGIYPFTNNINSIGVSGDGVTTTFTGVIQGLNTTPPTPAVPVGANASLLMNQVLFSAIDANNNSLALVDVPVVNTATGNPTTTGNLYVPGTQPTVADTSPGVINPPTVVNPNNNINYATGAFTITFSAAPAANSTINSQTVLTVATLPQAVLFYQNQFTVRPVPNQSYAINFEVYIRPTHLLTGGSPQLEEWWQYIAYGSAKKILEDRMDLETVAMIMPEYKKQEALCLRRTLVQYSNERVATIYTEQTSFGPGSGSWGIGGGPF